MYIIGYDKLVRRLVPEAARNRRFLRADDGEHDAAHRSAANERDEEQDADLRRA
jgi:hypothetical protein